ncbi:MAG: chromosome partitioning protein ParB, chromosome partitioning protein ParB family [Candidatus Parcubacteria bacterium]|jgi:ParB family chromosome partitioning protein
MAFQADSIFWVEVEKIVPNPFQPRREFDESKLKELSESIRMYGILQPLTVTRKEIQGQDGSFRSEYELIAGERRLRASKLAGLQIVPVIIRDGEQSEQEKLELAIIENLQREDLNAVDRALAFRQLADVFGLSHSQVAVKVGRSREYVSNSIRLLGLPDYMLSSLRTNDITEGHARTLLMLNDRPEEQDVVFREILLKKLSVREVEKIARSIATEKVRRKELIDTDLLEIEKRFTDTLGTRVSITKTEFGGRLTIDYFSVDDLEEMLVRMKKEAARQAVPAVYQDESKDTVVSDVADEAEVTLAMLAASTGIEPVVPVATEAKGVEPVHESLVLPEVADDTTNTAITDEIESLIINEIIPDEILPIEPAAVSVVEKEIPVPTPVTAAPVVPVVAPVVTPSVSNNPKLSLRDQLAALLGNKSGGVPMEPAATPVPPQPTTQPITSTSPAAPSSHQAPETDSDLYSVNKFTI